MEMGTNPARHRAQKFTKKSCQINENGLYVLDLGLRMRPVVASVWDAANTPEGEGLGRLVPQFLRLAFN
jgi:hypothetical protein